MNLGKTILEYVGGESNVKTLVHCATRLRFTLYDESIAKAKEIENLDDVISVMRSGGQFQVVVGTNVKYIYKEAVEGTNLSISKVNEEVGEKKNILSRLLETLSGLFTPLLPLLAGSGLLRGLVLLSTQLGILSDTSSTYTILTVASTAVFYFLPVLLAYTASKTFECDSYVAVAVMGALMMPDFINLMGDVGNGAVSSFMGIPVVLMTYSSTVIPAVLSIYVLSKLEKLLNKIIPTTVQLCFVPLISLLVMVPLTAMAIGPVGVYLGTGIATVITKLVNFNGWLAGAVMGGGWNILVILGIHWAVNPIMIQNVSVAGFDYMVPLTCATNFGVAGATLGTFLKTKDEKMKQFSLSAILSIFFAGITEPANYGVCVKYKKPLVAAFIGGAAGGAFMGGMKVKAFAFVFGGLTTIPAFAGPTLIYYVIGLAICFFVSFAIMMVIGIEEENVENIENKNIDEVISLPVAGEVKDLATCSDKTFASGQLGEGAVILPSEGVVYAPFDGTMEMIFDTLHAFNMKSDHGTSLFVHVGLDTVELAGKPFKVFVKKGQHVKQGQKIMEFDMDQIKKAGKSTEVILLVDNAENVSLQSVGKMQKGDKFLSVRA